MKRIYAGLLAGTIAIGATTGLALAAGRGGAATMGKPAMQPTTPSGQARASGQPNASCGSASAPNTPGNAASAPGSAFNPNGTAGGQYAGQQPQNSKNPARRFRTLFWLRL